MTEHSVAKEIVKIAGNYYKAQDGLDETKDEGEIRVAGLPPIASFRMEGTGNYNIVLLPYLCVYCSDEKENL